ncbi:MAG TPA: FmdB family zinc ribbon protein [Halanaerobiales bacterium]|nr:FmdB family zinc ribbon protein [Halanaerobiales bacterium]
MPTYLYECKNCGRFEVFQKITADPLKECPECQGEVKRIIGAPGVIFKGSGFYCTDSRKEARGKNIKNNQKNQEKTANETKAKPKNSSKERVS